jgi:hypothetical protein
MANANLQFFVKSQKVDLSKCLCPLDCTEKAIKAHSIQNANVMDLLQTNGHVLMPRYVLSMGETRMEIGSVGRQDASTFTGLCSKHDTELFKAIDTRPLNIDDCEQQRQLATRAYLRQFHTELQNADRSWFLHEQYCKENGLRLDNPFTPQYGLYEHWIDKARELYLYYRNYIEVPLEQGRCPTLRHLIITMDNQAPVLAVSDLFSVGHTDDGEPRAVMLSVMPLGPNYTVAFLTYAREHEDGVKAALASVFNADEKTLKHELAKLIIERAENFALSPAHYAKWSDERKKRVIGEFQKTLTGGKVEDHPDLNIFL